MSDKNTIGNQLELSKAMQLFVDRILEEGYCRKTVSSVLIGLSMNILEEGNGLYETEEKAIEIVKALTANRAEHRSELNK